MIKSSLNILLYKEDKMYKYCLKILHFQLGKKTIKDKILPEGSILNLLIIKRII